MSTLEQGYPEGSTLFYPVLLYYHGFRFFNMGYASAMAMLLLAVAFAVTLVIVRNSRRWVHYSGGGAMSATRVDVRSERRKLPRAVRRQRFLISVAEHSLLIAAAIAFLAPVVFIALTALMTTNQALSPVLWPETFEWQQLRRGLSQVAALALDAQHDDLRGPGDARRRCSRASRSRTRSRACAGRGATRSSSSCSSR